MAILKVIEILANSHKSWEDAAQNAVKEASKTVKNISSVNVNNFSITVKDGKVDEYRVNVKVTFFVDNK
ncbi:dodecin family protein [Flavobacteriaceae bacterium]|jgi:dodecin|nr:dodecin domain-containing protein [Flavobacteriaceae bacterium]MDA7712308.1 dodecin family protein [Flavobacteriaceae bacterium]